MSRNNKVNPDHYTMAGRLTPDELARQRMQQGGQPHGGGRRSRKKAVPPWMVHDQPGSGSAGSPANEVDGPEEQPEEPNEREAEVNPPKQDDAAGRDAAAGAGMPRRRSAQKRGAPASRKGSRPAPRAKATGQAAGRGAKKPLKSSGARGTPRGSKAPKARGSAARGSSPQRAGKAAARTGRKKGSGTTRKAQKK